MDDTRLKYVHGEKRFKLRLIPALAHNNLGVAYGKLGRYREEAKACRQAIKIKPDLDVAHYNLALSYLRLGERHSEREEERTLDLLNPSLAAQLRDLVGRQFTVRVGDVAALHRRVDPFRSELTTVKLITILVLPTICSVLETMQ